MSMSYYIVFNNNECIEQKLTDVGLLEKLLIKDSIDILKEGKFKKEQIQQKILKKIEEKKLYSDKKRKNNLEMKSNIVNSTDSHELDNLLFSIILNPIKDTSYNGYFYIVSRDSKEFFLSMLEIGFALFSFGDLIEIHKNEIRIFVFDDNVNIFKKYSSLKEITNKTDKKYTLNYTKTGGHIHEYNHMSIATSFYATVEAIDKNYLPIYDWNKAT